MAARNYLNLATQQQEESLHRRVNTEGPSRNQAQFDSNYSHSNILVDQQQVNQDNNDEEDELGLDGIDAEQLRQMMSDPRYAALFAAHYGNMQYMRSADGEGNEYGYEDEEEEGSGKRQYIDFNNLNGEQQQYFLGGDDEDEDVMDDEEDEEEDHRTVGGIVGRGNGHGFFAEGDDDEGTEVQFFENAKQLQQKFEYDEEGRMLPEVESDYCEDLAEVYIHNGCNEDVVRYKAIHLMDKGPNYNLDEEEGEGEKFQCPETGSHFAFLEMCRRLKRLQTLRITVDKVIEDQVQHANQIAAQAAALKLQQQQIQQSPTQPRPHQRTESAVKKQAAHQQQQEISARRQALIEAKDSIVKKSLHLKQVDAALYNIMQQHPAPHESNDNGVYSVYGSSQQAQRSQAPAVKVNFQKQTSSNRVSNGGYQNTQETNYNQHQFQTEAHPHQIEDGYSQDLRRQQLILSAPENDDDEIIDLLVGPQSQQPSQLVANSSTVSKMSMQQPSQQQQQRKPPITGSTQKKQKSISSLNNKLFDQQQQQICFTDVRDANNHDERAQQIAYNNFFKLGTKHSSEQQHHSQPTHGKRQQLDIKTQKDLELLALSQQFIEQHVKVAATAPFNNRNQQHQPYSTHTYFTQNANHNQQTQQQPQQQQRTSKRQASAGGGLGGVNFMSNQKQQTSKKTRTGSTSQAFNTHYGSHNMGSNKFINNSTGSNTNNGVPAPPIVMVMNPQKQTQIQNILMNFYQNTNSRANQHHHHYDQRVYPTKASNKHSNTASIVANKGGPGTKQNILVSTDIGHGQNLGSKILTSSSHHSTSQHGPTSSTQFKSFSGVPTSNTYVTTQGSGNLMDRKNLIAIQKLHNKQLNLKKPNGPVVHRNQNGLVAANTIDNARQNMPSSMQISQPNQQILVVQQHQNTEESNNGSRPCSAIKKKSLGMSPNSKIAKQHLNLIGQGAGLGSRQSSNKVNSNGKPSQQQYYNKYDALNPKYIQFKSRDSQHKKTNSFSLGAFSASLSSYQKKVKNLNPAAIDTYQIQPNSNQNYATADPNNYIGRGFIDQATSDQLMTGGTPNSLIQGTKRSLLIQPQSIHQPIYETSPPSQKKKSIIGVSNLKLSTGSKQSRQPNHIISSGGIIGNNKLASATVQESSMKVDMNAIIKKLGVRKSDMMLQAPHAVTFDLNTGANIDKNQRYGSHQHAMSFAGKKITAVPTNGAGGHQTDATKRLSVNLQAGYSSKLSNAQTFQMSTNKVRNSHSKGKATSNSNVQSRHTSVVPSSHIIQQQQQLQHQSKSTKRIAHQGNNSIAAQINSTLFASSKKSNRVQSGISYDYRSSERRCDTVS